MGAVEKRITNIFMKLDLPPEDDHLHRRVMAVVRYLNSAPNHDAQAPDAT